MDVVVQNVTKKYGSQKAVDDISFTVKTGEIVGFLGPNGAGKTTTMKAITGFFAPDNGDIRVGGISVSENPVEVKRLIGYLPETNPLYQEMGVIDYLFYVARLQGLEKERIPDRIREMVSICGLAGEKHKKIGELSKGYKQRVGLAQALIHDPAVLILDEPTSGLDPNQIVEIRELIKRIGKQKTVILSSHILAEVEATCDRILIISKGKIVANGTPADLRKQAQGHELLKVTIEGAPRNDIFSALKALDGVKLVNPIEGTAGSFEIESREGMSNRRQVFTLCVSKGWFLTELTPVETKLEDIFRELTMN
ncbi:MAG: ATP-binding cassette domain-containing protein [Bacteroidales bacterium]|nr:ATP-binding cassette domain-containing protein [Bacteroidales bacterium]